MPQDMVILLMRRGTRPYASEASAPTAGSEASRGPYGERTERPLV